MPHPHGQHLFRSLNQAGKAFPSSLNFQRGTSRKLPLADQERQLLTLASSRGL